METADLELSIRKTEINAYSVELRFHYERHANVNASYEGSLHSEHAFLLAATSDLDKYGRELTEYFFQDAELREAFLSAVNATKANGDRCRIRLFIGHTALELQKLRWELLEIPGGGRIATSDQVLFSRYLFSRDFRSVVLRPRVELRVLIAVSALTPANLEKLKLAPLDASAEVARAQKCFSGLSFDAIGDKSPLTLAELWRALRRETYDILYLVGHGTSQGRPVFFIEREEVGRLPYAEPQEFVDRFSGLLRVPRLIVLGSCQSGFTNMALGPRLVEAGIPTVIAMQDNISLPTLESFTTRLFSELAEHGVIDQAVASARNAISERPDSWIPVLFSRLKDNRIWFDSGFKSQPSTPAFWEAIIFRARRAKLIPVIGPGFGDYIHGDARDLAKIITDVHKLPRLLWSTDSFPQVCQSLLAVKGQRDVTINHIREAVRQQVRRYHYNAGILPRERFDDDPIEDLLWEVRQALLKNTGPDAYDLLAELDTPLFVTTTRDSLLERALKAKGKTPQVVECPWRKVQEPVGRQNSVREAQNLVGPSVENPTINSPIVYHVFGTFKNEDGLVLTEDDFFEFLIQSTYNRDKIPEAIRSKTMHGSLAFLGFHLTDWSLRVLQYVLKNEESHKALNRHKHVAVQLNRADDVRTQDANLATFLSGLIQEFGDVQIFWGRPEDFLNELFAGIRKSNQPLEPAPQVA
jgi:hypothetical protein